jgi:hypothetical protein
MKTHQIFSALAAMTLWLAGINIPASSVMAHEPFSSYVDDTGEIAFPKNFRANMVHLGSWFVPEGGASGFHDVYTEKSSIEYYQQHQIFPDGATLVKELRAASTDDYTTGKGVSHANHSIKQWFVMIKDSRGRFTDNQLWGEGWGWGWGWGWALFKPDGTKQKTATKNVATNYKTECVACHIPTRENDLIYVEAYPMLKE